MSALQLPTEFDSSVIDAPRRTVTLTAALAALNAHREHTAHRGASARRDGRELRAARRRLDQARLRRSRDDGYRLFRIY